MTEDNLSAVLWRLFWGLLASPGPKESWGGPEMHADQARPVTARSGHYAEHMGGAWEPM